MTAIVALDFALRGAGAAAVLGGAILARKLSILRRANCDAACAAAVMPADAYKGKVVWITGASSGIGKEFAVQLARQGAKLILSARREQVLQDVAAELSPLMKASGGEVKILPLDLEDLASLPGKATEALASFGGTIDVLVNNGGYSSRALGRETQGITEEVKMMNVNFLSCVALAKAVLPNMYQRKTGTIINISSLAGKFGSPLRTLYCGAKHALIGWFDVLRLEEAGFFKSGITVTNACPGSVKTDVARNAVTAGGTRLGVSDPGIDSGLEPSFVCDRILASAYCGLDEVWIAKPAELQAVYMNQYLPATFKSTIKQRADAIIRSTMGNEFADASLRSRM